MTKTWEQLTDSEKTEDLRNDVVRIFSTLNRVSDDLSALQVRLFQAETSASKVEAMVSALKDQVGQLQE